MEEKKTQRIFLFGVVQIHLYTNVIETCCIGDLIINIDFAIAIPMVLVSMRALGKYQ
jgi:hypothetical protein